MFKADVIKLISYTPVQHGTFDTPTETRREVFAEVKSVARTEAYAMLSQGMTPSYIFKLSLADDYAGETECAYNGSIYRIVRSYETRDGGVELTVERVGVDRNV